VLGFEPFCATAEFGLGAASFQEIQLFAHGHRLKLHPMTYQREEGSDTSNS
jgi:hypothetical protein